MIFVFGSNLAGRHGRGAALFARQHHGAIYGQGWGRQGNSYAIPTKNYYLQSLPAHCIGESIGVFLDYAREHPELQFQVTRIGCGLADHTDARIAPYFQGAPSNCHFDPLWKEFL